MMLGFHTNRDTKSCKFCMTHDGQNGGTAWAWTLGRPSSGPGPDLDLGRWACRGSRLLGQLLTR